MKLYQNRDSGFTLVEALATAAILIILLGLSAVGVARWRDPLKITELDNAARAIYMAAENRAVLLQNSGAAVSLLTVPDTPGAGDLTSSSAPVTQDGKDKTVSLCVLSNATKPAILDELLPVGVIDPTLREGCFYILYDRSTYHVFEVFYAEKPFSFPADEKDMKTLRGSRSDRVSYYRGDTAHRCLVGHYEGGLAGKIGAKPLPTPGVEVSITNGNELTLTVKYTIPNDLPSDVKYSPSVRLNYPGAAPKEDLLSVNDSGMIIPVDGGRLSRKGDLNIAKAGDTVTYTWVLDSLEQDGGGNFTKQFKGLFSDLDTIAFGGDFTVTASLELSADGYISSSFSPDKDIQDNSLFAKTPEGGDANTAYIANLRHLQNLDTVCSGAAKKTTALQLKDIDCKRYTKDNGDILVADYEFIPIENWDLTVYNARPDKTAFSISHLKVTKATASTPSTGGADTPKKSAGLFYAVDSGFTFENVRLINSYVEGTAQVGGLVGEGSNLTFTNCRLEDVTVTHPSGTWYWGYCGGLVGYWYTGSTATFMDCEVKNSKVESSSAAAGGMAGGGSIATFTGCTVTGGQVISRGDGHVIYAGGLLGYEDAGGKFERCRVVKTNITCVNEGGTVGGTAGGLVGGVKGEGEARAELSTCSTQDVTVKARYYAGGLVGLSTTQSDEKDLFENCEVSNATVSSSDATGDIGGLVGRSTKAKFKIANGSDITISGYMNVGGLVGYGENIDMENCKSVRPDVTALIHAGGMVGTSRNASLTGCVAESARVASTEAWGASGGMVGTAENGVKLEKCQVYWDKSLLQKGQYVITGANAGGLVGKITNAGTITESFAATLVKGDIYAGGLVGSLSGVGDSVSVTKSYADCYLNTVAVAGGETKDWAAAGGLIGAREQKGIQLTLENVYAAGFITGRGQVAGGLLGSPTEGDITAKNAYAAMHYDYELTTWGKIYPLGAALAWGQGTNCYWWKYPSSMGIVDNNIREERSNYNQMSDQSFANTLGTAFQKPASSTVPYNLDGGSRTTYPFPALSGLPHYGDWYQHQP